MVALENPELYKSTCDAAKRLVKENQGSAKKIVQVVLSK
jgi:3-deoxy-D-manno-octulosonic-acid transferase